MHRLRMTLPVMTILLVGAHAHLATAAPGEIQQSFASPSKYPAGLTSDGESFYLVDWRSAKIHKLSATESKPADTFNAPTLRPHGLTWGNDRLYVSDDHSGWIYAYDPASGLVTNSFEAPDKSPAGLAWADGALYILERRSKQIYKVLPEDGTILGYFEVPSRHCTCLAWDGTYLWVSDRVANEIYMVDPQREMVVGVLDAPGPYAAGLTWHANHLWNVDFQKRELYQLEIHGEQPYRLTDTRRARVEYLWALYNYGPADVRNLQVNLAVPTDLPQQKLLSELTYEPQPTTFARDDWEQQFARFEFDKVPGGTRQLLSYHVQAEVSAIRYLIFPDRVGTLADIPTELRQQYTANGSRYRIDSEFVRELVKDLIGDEQNPYWIARRIFNHLIGELEYQMIGGWDVPEVVLKRGTGSCSEYTFAFIALCRAAGVPARYQGSIVVRGDDASIDESFHRWAEIYLPNYGWVPVDANAGDKPTPAQQAHGFGELSNRFLITTIGGGDSQHIDNSYNSHATYQATGYCKVEQENFGFWEPLEEETDADNDVKKPATPGECRME